MSKATISRGVDAVSIIGAAGQATAPALQIRDQNFPAGDQALRALVIHYDATMSGTSTPTRVTNGHWFFLNGLTVESDKHNKIVDNVDGLLFATMNLFEFKTNGNAIALSATPADTDTPAASWIVPFSLYNGINPYDTNLDVLLSRVKVSTQYGPQTNLWTQGAGTPLVKNLRQVIEAKILPGPLGEVRASDGSLVQASETPIYMRNFSQILVPITATESRKQIALPFGDRIYRRIFITQRNTSTLIEMSNVIAPTAKVSLYINSIPVVDNREFQVIRDENKLSYGFETLPTGVAVLDFDADMQERIFDMLHTVTKEAGNAYLYIDVTTQTNGAVLLGLDCLREIPAAARRG